MEEKENVLRILKEAREAIKEEDSMKLKELSNQTIHTASVEQDPENVAVAVIIYSLSKLIERKYYQANPGWEKFYNTIISSIDGSIIALKENDEKALKTHLELIRNMIHKLSGHLRRYIQDVFRKASINKASKIYEHGISMERTAGLLGITMFELASYSGQTSISDVPLGITLDARSRIKFAMEMFG